MVTRAGRPAGRSVSLTLAKALRVLVNVSAASLALSGMVEVVGSELRDVGGGGVGGVDVGGIAGDGVIDAGFDPPSVSVSVSASADGEAPLLNGSNRSTELRIADLIMHACVGSVGVRV